MLRVMLEWKLDMLHSHRGHWIIYFIATILAFLWIFMDIAKSETFLVPVDQARLMPLKKQGSAVIVGNPSIADVSVQNGKLLVVTGKSYGSTNVIVLDSQRKIIANKIIDVVSSGKSQSVQIYKGSMRQTYNCAAKCSAVMAIGDEPEFTKNVYTATTNKAALVANGGAQGNSGQ